MNHRPKPLALTALTVGLAVSIAVPASAATAKVGGVCARSGAKSGSLTCARVNGKLVWRATAKASTSTTRAAAAATPAPSPSPTPQVDGVEGAWKPGSRSVVGYRVKENLNGNDVEGVGRTNAVTGSMAIAGTKVTALALSVDVATLQSDSGQRDGQVRGRILNTSQFPTATLKLSDTVDFGAVPADGVTVTAKATGDLTLRGVTKSVTFDVAAKRVGATIQVVGSIPINFPAYSIPNPSAPFAKVGDDGMLEFAVEFVR